jgi:hypothetical protein
MRTQVLCSGTIGRHSRLHHDAVEYRSVALFSLPPLRSPRSYAANDKRSLPQSARSCGEKDMEPMRTQVLCSGAIGRHSRLHHDAWGCRSVTLLSLRSPRSYAANDKRSLPQSAQSCGEKDMEPMRTQVLCSGTIGRHSRLHHDAWGCRSVTLLSLRPLRALR